MPSFLKIWNINPYHVVFNAHHYYNNQEPVNNKKQKKVNLKINASIEWIFNSYVYVLTEGVTF